MNQVCRYTVSLRVISHINATLEQIVLFTHSLVFNMADFNQSLDIISANEEIFHELNSF